MDGWQLIQAIRGHATLADTPVVILSGHLCPHDPQPAESGACAMLLKPCSNKRILATVELLLTWGAHRHGAGIAACPLRASQAVPASEAVVG
jgi:CheY-like chemotaxis protein